MVLDRRGPPVRILHVVEAFGGGLFEIVRTHASEQAQRGHAVALAYGHRPETPENVRRAVDERVELAPQPWHRRTVDAQVRAEVSLRRLVRSWAPEIVHLHSAFAGVVGTLALPRDVVTLYTPHASPVLMAARGWQHFVYERAERFVLSRVDTVLASSHSEAALARAQGASRIVTVPNGIPELDPDRVPCTSPKSGRPLVIAAGRTTRQRQPDACARILSGVSDIAEVKWVGGGSPATVSRLVAEGVPVTGWLPREQVVKEFAAASAYLHWTAWDGLALSLLEALAYDTICVASDIPPSREVLGPEQVFCSEKEAVSFLRRVLLDEGERMRALGRQRSARSERGFTKTANGWLETYEGLLVGSVPSRRSSGCGCGRAPSRTLGFAIRRGKQAPS